MRRVLKRVVSRWQWRLRVALHTLLFILRRHRPLHLVVTGPDDVLAEHLARVLALSLPIRGDRVIYGSGKPLLKKFDSLLVALDPNALRREREFNSPLARYRDSLVVVAVDDPRNLVSERSDAHPYSWRQGFDYRLVTNVRGQRSFTDPGVIDRLDDIETVGGTAHVVVVRRERWDTDLHEALLHISKKLPRRLKGEPKLLGIDTTRRALSTLESWRQSPERKERVARQIALCPELEERSVSLGYDAFSPGRTRRPRITSEQGIIIAFHTPDEVYRAEAARLEKSLKKLGLPYRITEVSPEKNWVRTTLLKPRWITPLRESLSGPLLYIDVDAFVHENPWPYLSGVEGDMATFVGDDGAFNSATIWINDTEGAREILRRWSAYADTRRDSDSGQLKHQGDHGDQGVLQIVIEEDEKSDHPVFRYGRLPINLTYIFDRPHLYRFGPVYIEQLQASREASDNVKRLERRRQRLLELGQ